MAEMTVWQAVRILTGKDPNKTLIIGNDTIPIIDPDDAKQIALLIQRQQAEIEGLKADRKETEKFYQDVNVGLCEEHFAVIKSQRAEIESLKCCGNCNSWRNGNVMQCMVTGAVRSNYNKCDKWEGLK